MRHPHRSFGLWMFVAVAAVLLLGCRSCRKPAVRLSGYTDSSSVLVTGYCNCGKCCNWRRSWFGFGRPVYDYGPMKGKPKRVGITASGSVAHRGTIAADPKVFPFGTVLKVPGYGEGVVEDIGGAIKGKHIDVWFPSHDEALRWGERRLKVGVIRKKR